MTPACHIINAYINFLYSIEKYMFTKYAIINQICCFACMICGITFYPGTCDPKDILLNRHTWEKGIFYCGDVQCKGKYGTYVKHL